MKDELSGKTIANAKTVASWMLEELKKQGGVLHQVEAASQIADLFGEQFTYENDSGNTCIEKAVLSAFRNLTGDAVVWSTGERLWRKRESGDEPTRQQN